MGTAFMLEMIKRSGVQIMATGTEYMSYLMSLNCTF